MLQLIRLTARDEAPTVWPGFSEATISRGLRNKNRIARLHHQAVSTRWALKNRQEQSKHKLEDRTIKLKSLIHSAEITTGSKECTRNC